MLPANKHIDGYGKASAEQATRTSQMSESAHISEPVPDTQCPACKKTLVTRSARLCLFCGEKLPEDLLLPLSEVQREEQRSVEKANRVNDAFEKREAQMLERARHFSQAEAMFGQQFKRLDEEVGDMVFPEIDAGKWALHEFSRTLKLPDDDFDARRHKRDLEDALRKLASKLSVTAGKLECKIDADKAGHLCIRLTDKAFSVVLDTQFGKNTTFKGGASQSFRSYTIRAQARVLALNKADRSALRLRLACLVAGLLAIPAGLVWLAYTIARNLGLEMFHRVWLNEIGVALFLLLGAWVGDRVGRVVAASIEKRAIDHAEAAGTLPRLESLWSALTLGIDELSREYEVM
jgi:hypothetical protein